MLHEQHETKDNMKNVTKRICMSTLENVKNNFI